MAYISLGSRFHEICSFGSTMYGINVINLELYEEMS